MDNLAHLVQSVQTLFGSLACQTALATGFVKRKSKLSAELFLTILVAGFTAKPNSSYADLAAFADLLGLNISRQALEERLNTPQALAFLQRMLDLALECLKLPPA